MCGHSPFVQCAISRGNLRISRKSGFATNVGIPLHTGHFTKSSLWRQDDASIFVDRADLDSGKFLWIHASRSEGSTFRQLGCEWVQRNDENILSQSLPRGDRESDALYVHADLASCASARSHASQRHGGAICFDLCGIDVGHNEISPVPAGFPNADAIQSHFIDDQFLESSVHARSIGRSMLGLGRGSCGDFPDRGDRFGRVGDLVRGPKIC